MSTDVLEMNPYAASLMSEPVTVAEFADNSEEVRKEHFKVERAIKSIGSFFGICAAVSALTAAVQLMGLAAKPDAWPLFVAIGGVQSIICVLLGASCVGLHRMKSWARWPSLLLALPLLAGFPIGTLIGCYILYSTWCEKGRFVLSEEYREIVRRTPQVKHRTEATTWIMLAVIVGLIAWAVIAVSAA